MSVDHVEILVEEPSMETALRLLLPKMIGDLSFEIYPYQCKQDLLANLPDRLRGYRQWIIELLDILGVLSGYRGLAVDKLGIPTIIATLCRDFDEENHKNPNRDTSCDM